MNDSLVLEMNNILKTFPGGVIANNNVNLKLRENEIHALLGENGAGKSTLMNVLYGLYEQDSGEIFINGKQVKISSPKDAIANGLGMVQQNFTLVPSFSVAENIILGIDEIGLKPDYKKIYQEIEELSKNYELNIDPRAKVWQLSIGEKQRVEILKLLYRNAKILILDEPTAVLTPQETDSLLKTLRKMADEGHSIIFITHKLEEVMQITDQVTVMRDGQEVGVFKTSETTQKELASAMVGRSVILKIDKSPVKKGETVLKLKNLHALNDKKLMALNGFSLEVARGEVVGIAGVAGNGQRELAEVISGMRQLESGEIFLKGINICDISTKERINLGFSFIPEDRIETGSCPNLSIQENLVLKNYRNKDLNDFGFILKNNLIAENAKELIEEYNVSTSGIKQKIHKLSGGNIQKVILARELTCNPDLILAVHPTRGLDISAIEFVYQSILKEREKNKAIIIIAGDLEEIFTLCDRVAVIYEGKIIGQAPAKKEYLEEIGLMMAGIKTEVEGGADIENRIRKTT